MWIHCIISRSMLRSYFLTLHGVKNSPVLYPDAQQGNIFSPIYKVYMLWKDVSYSNEGVQSSEVRNFAHSLFLLLQFLTLWKHKREKIKRKEWRRLLLLVPQVIPSGLSIINQEGNSGNHLWLCVFPSVYRTARFLRRHLIQLECVCHVFWGWMCRVAPLVVAVPHANRRISHLSAGTRRQRTLASYCG